MKNHFLKLFGIGIVLLFFFVNGQNSRNEHDINANLTLEQYYRSKLKMCLIAFEEIENGSNVADQIVAYQKARKLFKKLEPVMAYVATDSYETLNQANLLGVEELGKGEFIAENGFGFQVMEEMLFSERYDLKKFQVNLEKTKKSLKKLIQQPMINLNSAEILDLTRNQIVRTATLGITGFDSPQKQSLKEAAYNYQAISEIINLCKNKFTNESLVHKWKKELVLMEDLSKQNFDRFDRYAFIQDHTHYQLKLIQETAVDWQVLLPPGAALHPKTSSLFAENSFQAEFYVKSDYAFTEKRSALGEELFNDIRLSKTEKLSCASCHQKGKAFTDGLTHFEGQKRNTPSLFYAGLQNEYFYDMRSSSLQEQIMQVVENENEFHSDIRTITQKIILDSAYAQKFESAYQEQIDEDLLLDALSQYIKSLNPFNSKFDRNINKKENTLTSAEKNGFNLFMGKAECGTCHFAPVFNGTVPPYFTTTEMELLGVPKDSSNSEIDLDFGRHDVHSTQNRKHFFKTPTVRNVSKTAPYMHNGAYNTLFEVIEFYDGGGGVGLGFNLPFQTLPSDSLKLSKKEIENLITFLNSLEDSPLDESASLK